MRFFLVLAIIIGVVVFAFKSCSSKLSPDLPGKPSPPPSSESESPTPAASPDTPSVTLEETEAPPANATYTFSHRDIPAGLAEASDVLGLNIISDSSTRTVYLSGDLLAISDFKRFLQAVDQVPGSCAVRTWAVFVDRKAQRGFDLVAAIQSVIPETTATLGNGSFVLDTSAADIAMSLSVIADGSSVEVLQRPHVRLEHGVQSVIESIQEVPVPQTTASQGISQTSINYRKVGLQLAVTPHFLGNNHVRLAVRQTNGLIGQTVKIDGNEVPVIQSQTVDTQTTLAIGQTVILGGVATRRETVAKGLLRNVKEVSDGYLYVILSTSFDIPKAVPVGSQAVATPFDGVPLADPDPAQENWIMGELLPPRGSIPLPTK